MAPDPHHGRLTGAGQGAASRREVLRLAVPALGALAAEPLYVLADTAIVGHLGTVQLGGLGIASTVLLTAATAFIFLAYGTTGAVGRRIGAGDARGAAHMAVQGLWLALGLGVVSAAVLALAGPPIAGVVFALDGILIGAGDLGYLARAMSAVAIGFGVLALIILQADLSILWLWAALAAMLLGRLIPLLIRFRRGRWAVVGIEHP